MDISTRRASEIKQPLLRALFLLEMHSDTSSSKFKLEIDDIRQAIKRHNEILSRKEVNVPRTGTIKLTQLLLAREEEKMRNVNIIVSNFVDTLIRLVKEFLEPDTAVRIGASIDSCYEHIHISYAIEPSFISISFRSRDDEKDTTGTKVTVYNFLI